MSAKLPLISLIFLVVGCFKSDDRRLSGTTDTGNIPSIIGQVLQEDGTGYAGLTVIINDETYLSNGQKLFKTASLPNTITDKQGFFQFPMLRSGNYLVEATDLKSKSVLFKIQIDDEVKSINLKPKRLEVLQELHGQVTLDTRKPQIGVQVYGMERYAPVDSMSGGYKLLLPPGEYDIRISSPNPAYLPFELNRISVSDSSPKTLPNVSLINTSSPFFQWKYSNRISINTLSLSDLVVDFDTRFTLCLKLDSTTSGQFDFSQANADGSDLRFTNSNGVELPYEIEYWNAVQKTAHIWVLLDTLFNRNDKQFVTMYTGNPAAPSHSFGPNTFTGKAGAFHFSSATNALSAQPYLSNSASDRDHLIGTGPQFIDAKIHTGVKFKEQDHLIIASPSDAFTRDTMQTYLISFWIRLDSIHPLGSRIITLGNNFSIDISPEGKVQAQFRRMIASPLSDTTQISIKSNASDMANGKWRYVAFRITDNSAYLFIDGKVDNHLTFDIGFIAYQAGPLILGKNEAIKSVGGFTGELDELRLSPVPRSIFWNMLDFETQNGNTNIFSLNKSASN